MHGTGDTTGSVEGATPTRKRRRSHTEDSTPVPKRRVCSSGSPISRTRQGSDLAPVGKRRVNFSGSTPVRQFLSSVVPSESSPAVAVSICCDTSI